MYGGPADAYDSRACKPQAEALALVQMIGIPMTIVNGTGSFIFYRSFSLLSAKRNRRGPFRPIRYFDSGSDASFFRRGLNEDSCKAPLSLYTA
ncbi:LytS/YhcK type 5TM receptor domain-containing protein [Bacillus licheniformis]|nr:LytS/YhcK type 5TM receptor domain-containing protein [Bacillus licheniformis]